MSTRPAARPGPPWLGAGVGTLALVLGLAGLHLLGGDELAAPPATSLGDWWSWAEQRDPAVIALVVVRLGALVVGYHLIATSALAAIGRLLHRPHLVRLAEVATPTALRGTVRRLAGLGLSATAALVTPLAGAAAGPAPGTATLAVAETPEVSGTATLTRVAPERPQPEPDTTDPRPSIPKPQTPAMPTPPPAEPIGQVAGRHVAGAGDHLWSIAQDALSQAWGRPAHDREVDGYWRSVVAANPAIADPDLLFVGDVVLVPPPPAAPS